MKSFFQLALLAVLLVSPALLFPSTGEPSNADSALTVQDKGPEEVQPVAKEDSQVASVVAEVEKVDGQAQPTTRSSDKWVHYLQRKSGKSMLKADNKVNGHHGHHDKHRRNGSKRRSSNWKKGHKKTPRSKIAYRPRSPLTDRFNKMVDEMLLQLTQVSVRESSRGNSSTFHVRVANMPSRVRTPAWSYVLLRNSSRIVPEQASESGESNAAADKTESSDPVQEASSVESSPIARADNPASTEDNTDAPSQSQDSAAARESDTSAAAAENEMPTARIASSTELDKPTAEDDNASAEKNTIDVHIEDSEEEADDDDDVKSEDEAKSAIISESTTQDPSKALSDAQVTEAPQVAEDEDSETADDDETEDAKEETREENVGESNGKNDAEEEATVDAEAEPKVDQAADYTDNDDSGEDVADKSKEGSLSLAKEDAWQDEDQINEEEDDGETDVHYGWSHRTGRKHGHSKGKSSKSSKKKSRKHQHERSGLPRRTNALLSGLDQIKRVGDAEIGIKPHKGKLMADVPIEIGPVELLLKGSAIQLMRGARVTTSPLLARLRLTERKGKLSIYLKPLKLKASEAVATIQRRNGQDLAPNRKSARLVTHLSNEMAHLWNSGYVLHGLGRRLKHMYKNDEELRELVNALREDQPDPTLKPVQN